LNSPYIIYDNYMDGCYKYFIPLGFIETKVRRINPKEWKLKYT